jgi:hypothetical protein
MQLFLVSTRLKPDLQQIRTERQELRAGYKKGWDLRRREGKDLPQPLLSWIFAIINTLAKAVLFTHRIRRSRLGNRQIKICFAGTAFQLLTPFLLDKLVSY